MTENVCARVFRPDICHGYSALITGGGSGIGLEIASQLGQFGAKVTLMGRRLEVLERARTFLTETKGVSEVLIFSGDVRDPKSAQNAVDLIHSTFGHLDVLVNAAAGNFLAVPENLSTNGFKTVMDIDAVGCFNMCRTCFPLLKASTRQATIINISANLQMYATWYQAHAAAAKAAIDSLTHSLALEWGSFGISVVGIAPGPIKGTPGLTKLSPDISEEDMDNVIKGFVPMGRLGSKADMASIVIFLVTAGAYITGHTIVADGGQRLFREPMLPREMVASFSKKIEGKSRSQGLAKNITNSKL